MVNKSARSGKRTAAQLLQIVKLEPKNEHPLMNHARGTVMGPIVAYTPLPGLKQICANCGGEIHEERKFTATTYPLVIGVICERCPDQKQVHPYHYLRLEGLLKQYFLAWKSKHLPTLNPKQLRAFREHESEVLSAGQIVDKSFDMPEGFAPAELRAIRVPDLKNETYFEVQFIVWGAIK
jgi:hypothetical protein